MSFNKPIRRIAIVGTGVIGASWAAQYWHGGQTSLRPTRLQTLRPICASTSTTPGDSSKKSACRRARRATA